MVEMVSVAIVVGYLGDEFHGSQVQPDVRTVQGDLEAALRDAKVAGLDPKLRMSSRTDAGVTARVNVGVVDIKENTWSAIGGETLATVLNDRISDMVVMGAMEVELGWNPRIAKSRTYRYRMEAMKGWPEQVDEDSFREFLAVFEGAHDFTGFCRMEDRRFPFRSIERCEPWFIDGRIVGFEIEAESFLWNQVRRIAFSILQMCKDLEHPIRVSAALREGMMPELPGLASSRWLTLWDIDHGMKGLKISYDPFENLTPPPVGLNKRNLALWQSTAVLEQKLLLLRHWVSLMQ